MRNPRFMDTGPGGSIWNMSLDWALLHLRGEGVIPDTLRFYTWRERAVSVGYSQAVSRELDTGRCGEFGVDVVFRPTGGALVLHRFDLTYSVVVGMPEMNPAVWSDFGRRVAEALCRGLRSIGLEPARVDGCGVGGGRNRGACFSSLAGNEITVKGRKLIGSARRWRRGALLQHGSIAVRNPDLSLVDLMAGLTGVERESRRRELEERSTTIEAEAGRVVTCDELRPIMLGAFEEEFGSAFESGGLSSHEESMIGEFVELAQKGPEHRRCSRNGRRRLAPAGGGGR